MPAFSADELIRQITINCAERGLLLLRVRDEARMTITAYETLYESSIAYGVRKALVAEQKRIDLDAKLRELAMAKRELQQQVESLKHTIESTQARSVQKRDAEEKVHAEEVSSDCAPLCELTVALITHMFAHLRHATCTCLSFLARLFVLYVSMLDCELPF
jgi:hypothetical protein